MAKKGPRPHTTAVDVARIAGVSQSAVSRAFTPGASVAPETRKLIRAAANKLGYRPNLVARSLITRRSNLVGVVVPGTENPFYGSALDELSFGLAKFGLKVLLFSTDPATGSDPVVDEVLNYRVDALVLISTTLSSHLSEECQQLGLPVVMLNRKTDSGSTSNVTGDNRRGSQLIAEFLLAAGHKRFAFLAGLEHSSTSRDREEGFMSKLVGGQVERRVANYNFSASEEATRSLLSARLRPDAIFCANDYMALAALGVAQFEFGLQPGRDISIVGFDDIEMSAWPQFSLTTYSQPVSQMVGLVIEVLRTHLSDPSAPSQRQVVAGELIVRGSSRLPKKGLRQSGEKLIWSPAWV